jgi:carboxyl-terminal processing protease
MNKNNFPIYLSFAAVFGILIGTFFNGGGNGLSMNSSVKKSSNKDAKNGR